MFNFKQILYFTLLFLLSNASHTLCHFKEPQTKKSCTCVCSDGRKMEVNSPEELMPNKSDVGKQMEVNTTQESKPNKIDAGKQTEVNTTKESKTNKNDAGKQMEVNTTQESKANKNVAGKQMEVNTTQESKTNKNDAVKKMEANTTQESKANRSDAAKQMEANTTQESKTNKNDAGKQMEANTTQESKPDKSHAGKQMEVNTTQESKPNKSDAGKQVKVNATQAQHSELLFMNWVSFVGKLKHTSFKAAENKVTPSFSLTVDKNAALGDFTCIQDAIDSLPMINLVRVVIKVHAGVYTEKVSIPATKSFISIEGEGAEKTIIQWGDTAQTIGPNGTPLGAYGSATFAVNSPYFIAKNITVKNTAPGAAGKQAVAFRISADAASLVGCKFLGAQDTLYDHLGRHYYKDCYIEGSVDFIFGNGLSMFENCGVHAIAGAIGAVTAQARKSILDYSGFSFMNCKVTGSGALYLGRACGAFSRVVFAHSYMDNIIIQKGWHNWGDPSREMNVFYGQYKCSGPGADHAGSVSWSRELTDEEAKPFISLAFIDGSEWVDM